MTEEIVSSMIGWTLFALAVSFVVDMIQAVRCDHEESHEDASDC